MGVDAGKSDALRVIVADADGLLGEGVSSLLGGYGFIVVVQTGNATEPLALVRAENPDLLVVDIRMPPTNTTEGLDVAGVIRGELPDIGILVLSAHVEVEHAVELLSSGHAIGYLLKSRGTDVAEFIDSLQRIANGGSVMYPPLHQDFVSRT